MYVRIYILLFPPHQLIAFAPELHVDTRFYLSRYLPHLILRCHTRLVEVRPELDIAKVAGRNIEGCCELLICLFV